MSNIETIQFNGEFQQSFKMFINVKLNVQF